MPLVTPTLAEVAVFSGRPQSDYSAFITEAISQARLMFRFAAHITEMPADVDEQQLVKNGIMAMADTLYLAQPYDAINASPIVSQQIGSTSYTRATYGKFMERIKAGEPTGVYWFDLAVMEVGESLDTVTSQSWRIFEDDLTRVYSSTDDVYAVLGPISIDPPTGPFTVSEG